MASKRRYAAPLNPALAGSAGSGVVAPGSMGPSPVGVPGVPLQPTQPMGVAQPMANPMVPMAAPVGGFSQPDLSRQMGAMSLQPASAAPAGYTAPQTQNFGQNGYQTQAPGMMAAPSAMAQASMMINPAYQCPKEFMRMTLNAIPQSTDLANKSQIPLGVVVHPLAEVPDHEVRFFRHGFFLLIQGLVDFSCQRQYRRPISFIKFHFHYILSAFNNRFAFVFVWHSRQFFWVPPRFSLHQFDIYLTKSVLYP